MRILYLFVLLSAFIWMSGCSKNEDAGISFEYTPSDSALAGDYKITASLYYPGPQESPEDDYSLWDTCRISSIYHFSEDLLYEEENLVDCPDNVYGTWNLNGTDLVIKTAGISGDTLINTYPLQGFNLNSFKIRENRAQGDYYIKTFTRQ